MMRSRRRARWVPTWGVAVATLGVVAMPGWVRGQEEARPELSGQATLGGVPFPGAEVVLHRVSVTEAGEIDSVRTDTAGRFRLELPTVPREDEDGDIYFASVRHDGIVYFGRAVSRAVQLDSVYRIEAYDTLTAPVDGAPLTVDVRYVIAEEIPTGWRITDLFEIANDGTRTYVAAPDSGVTWTHLLPGVARDAEVGNDEVAPESAVVEAGALRVASPISPGKRQFVVRYEVPALDGLEIPVAAGTRAVEFLVREPAPTLEVEGLPGVESVEMQPGVTFRRYAASSPPSGAIRFREIASPTRLPMEWMAVVLALLLAGAGLYAVRRGRENAVPVAEMAGTGIGTTAAERRDRLLLEIARIDERLEAASGLDESARARLRARRADLIATVSQPE